MKKGYICQKDNLIKNLPYLYYKNYPNNCTFIFSIITKIMEDIELCEKSSQILFSESIGKLAETFSEKIKEDKIDHSNELKQILKHFLIGISTLEKSISDEYVIHFNDVINTFCKNNYKIIINKELIEYTISLGKFGQSFVNKKFSVFFCVSLIRISNTKIDDLYNRVLFLAEDTERTVKFEMAYHVRFLIQLNDNKFCQDKMINFLSYYFDDCDMNFLLIIFGSLFYSDNLSKFEGHSFMNVFYNKINEIISTKDFYTLTYDFHNISDIFLCLLDYIYNNNCKNKDLIKFVKVYLNNFFNVRELKISTNVSVSFKVDYCLKNFYKICHIFLKEKDIQFLNEIFPIAMNYYFEDNNNIDILYEILHLIISNIPNEFLNKAFFNKIFFFIEDDKVNNSSTINSKSNLSEISSNTNKETNSSNINASENNSHQKKEFKEIWLKNLDLITERMINIENDKFIKCLLGKFMNFLDLIKKCKEWRISVKLFKVLQYIPKYIMINYKKFLNYEDYLQILYNFSKDLLKNEINILIEKEITLLLAEVIHFSIFRKEILEYLKNNFLLSKSFYRRRIYCLFGDSAYKVFSKEFIIRYNIYTNLFDTAFLNDIPLMQSYIFQILIKYELFDQDLINKVKSLLNKPNKNDEIININIKKYLSLASNSQKLKNNNLKEKEKEDLEMKVTQIEKNFNLKDKKEESIYKKTVKQKSIPIGLGLSHKKGGKNPTKIFQKIEDKDKNHSFLRKSSMNNNNQENKINEYFHNTNSNNHTSNSSTNVPKIIKQNNKNTNNLSKSVNTIKNTNNYKNKKI